MPGVFISYRREDSAGFAGRLADDLTETFGPDLVFMDVTGIAPGVDFRKAIEQKVGDCAAVLVVIGQSWIGSGEGGTRLQEAADFVRLEVASALKRDILVIPVLVDGAAMPAARDLPPDLEPLAWRNAVELRHAHWDADLQVLVAALEKLLPRKARSGPVPERLSEPAPRAADSGAKRRWLWPAIAGAAAIAIIAIALLRPWQGGPAAVDPPSGSSRGSGRPQATERIRVDGDVTVASARYQILSAQLERAGTGPLILRFAVRMTNLKSTPDNFWDQSFRLVVDDAPMAPKDGLNELVDGYSAKDGEVIFEIDPSISPTALQVLDGNESTRIPIDLKAAAPPPAAARPRLAGPFPMTLAAVNDVRQDDVVYRVLAATIVRRNTEQLSLRLSVRATNQKTTPVNFWNQTFRLEVDGVPRAPTSDLNELLDGRSARQGEVEFAFADTVETLALLVGDQKEKARVPLPLRR